MLRNEENFSEQLEALVALIKKNNPPYTKREDMYKPVEVEPKDRFYQPMRLDDLLKEKVDVAPGNGALLRLCPHYARIMRA